MKQPVPIFEAHAVGGKPKMLEHERKSMLRWVSSFPAGSRLDIVIRKHRNQRTSDQNRYYWGTVVPILADHFGHDHPEDMHEDLKQFFNPVPSKIDPKKMIGGTTTTMTTIDFYSAEDSYIERICRWAAVEHGIYIPPPDRSSEGAK